MATLTVANCQIVWTIDKEVFIPADPYPVPITVTLLPTAEQDTLDAFDILFSPPVTCLSCGAKTNTAGELPCGH